MDEILTRRTDGAARELGADVGVEPVKVRGKRGKTQRVEEEMRRVRTEHSAAAALIDGLESRGSIGVLDGVLDQKSMAALRPGMVMELRAAVTLHPVFQIDALMTNYVKNAAALGQVQQAKELKPVLPLMRALLGTGDETGRILLDLDTGADQVARLVAFAERAAIQVPPEDLTGNFSALVQIDEILVKPGEEVLTLRAIRGAPPGKAERDGLLEGAQKLIEPAAEMGVSLTMADLLMPAPLVLLRPIALWR